MIVAGMTSLVVMSGCAPSERSRTPSPHDDSHAVASSTLALPITPPPGSPPTIPEGTDLPIARLVALACEHTPSRAILDAHRAMANAAIYQAQAVANPELELEAGQGRPRSGDSSEMIGRVAVRQRLEWLGKRSRRVSAAEAGLAIVQQDSRSMKIEVEAAVRDAVADLAVAIRSVTQAAQVAELAKQIVGTVQSRFTAGEADRGDALRADLDRRQTAIAVSRRQQLVKAAQAALNALCGGVLPSTFTVSDAWDETRKPTRDDVVLATEHHPLLERRRAVRAQRMAELEREEAAGRPDITVGAFAGRATDGTEAGLSVAIDLPVWNRNQGGIAAAQAEIQRHDAEAIAEWRSLHQSIEAAWSAYEAALAQQDLLTTQIEPLATDLVQLRLHAYQAGDIGLLDVLDARRTAQAIADDLLASRVEVMRTRNQLQAALGRFTAVTPVRSHEAKP